MERPHVAPRKLSEPFEQERINVRSLKLVCVCATILGVVLWVGYIAIEDARIKANIRGHARAWTGVALQNAGKSIWLLEYSTGQQAPITLPELVTWLVEGECASSDDFIDSWGRPIVLVVHGGKLVALGSKGPDGEWEGGKGDDVYVDLNEIRKRLERASRRPTSQSD